MLAGGRSSRFGSDKAAAMLDGRPLLDHVVAMIAPRADAVVVVGRADGIPDLPSANLGPLGGIAGALVHGARHGFATVLTLGCDMPRLPGPLIDALLAHAPSFCGDAPIIGHWPTAYADRLLAHIQTSPRRSVQGWARQIGALPVVAPCSLINVNTPADLAAL